MFSAFVLALHIASATLSHEVKIEICIDIFHPGTMQTKWIASLLIMSNQRNADYPALHIDPEEDRW